MAGGQSRRAAFRAAVIFGIHSGMMGAGDLAPSMIHLFSGLILGFIATWVGLRVAMWPRTA